MNNHKSNDLELSPLRNENEDKEMKEFDDVLEIVGAQGRFQKIILYAVICPIIALEPLFTLNTIFMFFVPEHSCRVDGRPENVSINDWKQLTIPKTIGPDGSERFSQCLMLDKNSNQIKCTNGWEYEQTDFYATIPSDFDWVCDKIDYSTYALTIAAVGNAVGTIIFGQLADRYGRKPIFFITLLINVLFRTISLFVVKFVYVFLFLQFVIGTAFPVMFISPSMIVAESCDKDFRGWVYAVTWMIWVGGMACLPYISWFLGHWFYIGLATSLPGFLLFLYWPYLPESPRWLLSVGRVKDAAEVIRAIAKSNGTSDKITDVQLDTTLKKLLALQNQDPTKNVGIWTLFSLPWLAKNTIMLTISWSMNIIVYYGITLNASNMTGSMFINFFLLSMIELPSSWLGGYLVDKVGRRWTQVAFFFISAICCLVAAVGATNPDLSLLTVPAVIIAKFAITLTFLVVYLQGTEIFPTQLRTTGSGFAATAGSAMGVTFPYIVFLGQYSLSAPHFVMALLSIFGMVASSFLPETFRQTLPETIEDANNFGKQEKFWSFLPESVQKEQREEKIRKRHCSQNQNANI